MKVIEKHKAILGQKLTLSIPLVDVKFNQAGTTDIPPLYLVKIELNSSILKTIILKNEFFTDKLTARIQYSKWKRFLIFRPFEVFILMILNIAFVTLNIIIILYG